MPSKDKPAKKAVKAVSKEHAVKTAKEPVYKETPVPVKKKGQFRKEWEHHKKALLDQRKSLSGDMAGLRDEVMGQSQQEASGDLSKMPIDMADVGSDNYERELNIGFLEKDQIVLAEIDEALQRMDEGTFGLCVNTDCGKPIPEIRLKAIPHAKHCIECQTIYDRKNRRPL